MKTNPTNAQKTTTSSLHPARKFSRMFYIVFGLLAMAIGATGIVMPFVPTTPLFLLAAFCFGKSSRRLHTWFTSTEFYKKNLESFMQSQGMTIKTKVKLLSLVTLFMGISLMLMIVFSAPLFARIVLSIVWFGHVLYFGFKVKTMR